MCCRWVTAAFGPFWGYQVPLYPADSKIQTHFNFLPTPYLFDVCIGNPLAFQLFDVCIGNPLAFQVSVPKLTKRNPTQCAGGLLVMAEWSYRQQRLPGDVHVVPGHSVAPSGQWLAALSRPLCCLRGPGVPQLQVPPPPSHTHTHTTPNSQPAYNRTGL